MARTPPPKLDVGKPRISIMDERLVRVRKDPAKHPRHAPRELGPSLRAGGKVQVEDLPVAAESRRFPISCDQRVEEGEIGHRHIQQMQIIKD